VGGSSLVGGGRGDERGICEETGGGVLAGLEGALLRVCARCMVMTEGSGAEDGPAMGPTLRRET